MVNSVVMLPHKLISWPPTPSIFQIKDKSFNLAIVEGFYRTNNRQTFGIIILEENYFRNWFTLCSKTLDPATPPQRLVFHNCSVK